MNRGAAKQAAAGKAGRETVEVRHRSGLGNGLANSNPNIEIVNTPLTEYQINVA